MRNLIGLILITLCYTSCQSTKISKLLTGGELIERNFTKTNDGIIDGGKINDTINNKQFTIKAKAVVNATGVFSDTIRNMDNSNVCLDLLLALLFQNSRFTMVTPGRFFNR